MIVYEKLQEIDFQMMKTHMATRYEKEDERNWSFSDRL